MFTKVNSVGIRGIDGVLVGVEADAGDGLPSFAMVGYLASEVKEAQDRVRTALKNSGFSPRARKVTVNLSPANIRKAGTAYDLSIALAVLGAYGLIELGECGEWAAVGELGLDGRIKPVSGVMTMVMAARAAGLKSVMVPMENVREGRVVEQMEIVGAASLNQAVELLKARRSRKDGRFAEAEDFGDGRGGCEDDGEETVDFREVNGQQFLRRAAEIAAAGMHNLLMTGPAGTGKTMIARRLPTILPSLTREEDMEISRIHSICGLLPHDRPLLGRRPFRSPHHTVTPQALAGGGRPLKPGELSLASGGVLFLDELTLFNRSAVEVLRQPLEEQRIVINRVEGSYELPADFILCAAFNSCPCGWYPDRNRCHCTQAQIDRYLGRLSKPLLERFDLCVQAAPVSYEELVKEDGENEDSASIRRRVEAARKRQERRFEGLSIRFNSRMGQKEIRRFCPLGKEEEAFLEQIYKKNQLSARTCHKVLKVARTIADLEGAERISRLHLAEAAGYRTLEERIWGN